MTTYVGIVQSRPSANPSWSKVHPRPEKIFSVTALPLAIALGLSLSSEFTLAAPCPPSPVTCITFDNLNWSTDRYSPDNVTAVNSFAGRSNVLLTQIGQAGFYPNRPSNSQTLFYDTQGIRAETGLTNGSVFVSSEVFINAAWQTAQPNLTPTEVHRTGNFVRVGLWGVGAVTPGEVPPDPDTNSSTTTNIYPIISFTNQDAPGHIEIWAEDQYLVVDNAPINYDGWNKFEMRLETTATGASFVYLLNGQPIYTISSANASLDSLNTIMLNMLNNNTQGYDVHWDNLFMGNIFATDAPIGGLVEGDALVEEATTQVSDNTHITGAFVAQDSAITFGQGIVIDEQLIAAGDSTLTIANGNSLQSAGGTIGLGGTSVATVSGPGSSWGSSENLLVGSAVGALRGHGSLTIADGGKVSVAEGLGAVILGNVVAGSLSELLNPQISGDTTSGTLNIGTGAAPGVLRAAEVTSGGGTATLNFNHTDSAYYFTDTGTASGTGIVISGQTAVNQQGSGTTILTAANTYTGATTISAGTLQTGIVDAFPSSSQINLGANGRLFLNGFDQAVSNLDNAGTVQLGQVGATPSTRLTVTHNYVGRGGTIALNTVLSADNSPSDRLVLDGPAANASGITGLAITNVGGTGALTTGNGILVVDAHSSTTAPGAFTLTAPVYAGPYQYTLHRSSIDSTNEQAWYLRSTTDPASPTEPPQANFRPQTALYAALPALSLVYSRAIIDTLHEREGEQRPNNALTTAQQEYGPALGWGRLIYRSGEQDRGSGSLGTSPQYNYDLNAFQVGLDLYRQEHTDGSRDQAGTALAIGTLNGGIESLHGVSAGDDTLRAYSLSGYWTRFGPMGWYLDSVLQLSRFDIEAKPNDLDTLSTDGWGYTASIEGGYPIQAGHNLYIEPQAQMSYSYVDLDASHEVAANVGFSDIESLIGRVGVRLAKDWFVPAVDGKTRRTSAWIRPSVWHDFKGEPETEFSSNSGQVAFDADVGGSWGEVNLGVDYQANARTTFYVSAGYQQAFDGDSHSYEGMLGVKVAF